MLHEEALAYHSGKRKGKIEVCSTKPTATQQDLTLAYSPGVAVPCMEIAKDPQLAYEYTTKGNLVGVVSNGTAVLGLGNIGPLASKPVMEGKGVLFKRFADIDVFDIEIDVTHPEEVIKVVRALGPTFGGINLEDIKGPECFEIETELRKQMGIPVFHDDQHGTAIITGAALLNALELIDKRIDQVKVVVAGAGAAGIGCAKFYLSLGVKKENIFMCDSRGLLHTERDNLTSYTHAFAQNTSLRTMADAMKDADVFLGLSAPNIVSPEMVQTMAKDPIIFALANPDPEIPYPTAKEARPDAIIATGRSDYPNQVNNVLCFPFIFRGALDTQARQINEEMKMAAARALARLVKEETPDEVLAAYGRSSLHFGREYLIPTPFDPRVLLHVAPAVAKAALESGVARVQGLDMHAYRDRLAARQGITQQTSRQLLRRAQKASKKRVIFPDGRNPTILRACHQIVIDNIAIPVLAGDERLIRARAEEWQIPLKGVEVLDILSSSLTTRFADDLFKLRARKGMERAQSILIVERPVEFALMMLKSGQVDAFVGGINRNFPQIVRPALQIIGLCEGAVTTSGFYMMLYRDKRLFFADATINEFPNPEQLADITIQTARAARFFGETPRAALLSYSNFGSVRNKDTARLTAALDVIRQREPGLMVDGEMQAHLAFDQGLRARDYPFSVLEGEANVLIFPNLHAANNGYRLLASLSEGEVIGPLISGMRQPVNLLPQEAKVQDVVNIAAISMLEASEGVL